jgi:hypothetical protein
MMFFLERDSCLAVCTKFNARPCILASKLRLRVPLLVAMEGSELELRTPLKRGCAMVRLKPPPKP